MFGKIVVGTDGYGPASRAVARAAELAARTGAEVIAVHVYPHTHPSGEPFGEAHLRSGIDAGQGILKDVVKRHSDVAVKTVLRQGDPAEVLLDVAEEEGADLVVVGNKGMRGRFHIGIVPNRVSHHAPCHVLIVHTTEG